MSLHDLVICSVHKRPDALAVVDIYGSLTYCELNNLANRFAHALAEKGVVCGDRVGIWLEKSAVTLAALQGVLRLGAIYVPLDPLSPAVRVRTIIRDCSMRVVVTTRRRAEAASTEGDTDETHYFCIEGDASSLSRLAPFSDEPLINSAIQNDSIAYILYTSGSTGKPKGVCISHRNALAFVEWGVGELQAHVHDRFANHAPLHFDLSVLDIYGAFASGATVYLIPDSTAYIAPRLVDFVFQHHITIWYSVPSVLILMMEQGGLLDALPVSALRAILFAGEPFPIKHLRRLFQHCSGVRFLNLYGPTETNVCTFFEVDELAESQVRSVPIGKACSGDVVWAQKEDGTHAAIGEEGELMVTGPTVMVGYWGLSPQGDSPYATGDLVRLQADGNYLYLGRRDYMVKVRGHRIELGDIEAALETHAAIQEAAVLVVGTDLSARLVAFVVYTGAETLSLLEVKRHCSERLPRYMIVDEVRTVAVLPRTRNGKIDRLALLRLVLQEKRDK